MWQKNLDLSQTIFALTTGPLPTAVAGVKLCGPDSFTIAAKIFAPTSGVFTKKRDLWVGTLRDLGGKKIDHIVLLSFISPHSHTGEDSIEFHCHGSVPIVSRLQQVLLDLGARPAERGEFSYRAHLNGKMSPEELETLGDLYLARQVTDLDRIYARKDGALEAQIAGLRQQLIRLQAILDTAVDFSEEYSAVTHQAFEPIEGVIRGCSEVIHRYSQFKNGENTPKLVLAGKPNAGKSSLFNALLCRYRAIVHEEPGTTRDVIEEDIEVDGRRWKLVDTAGTRENTAGAEREGIALGADFLASSHYWILVVDGTEGLTSAERGLLATYASIPHLIAWNKKDLPAWQSPERDQRAIAVSAKGGDGLAQLWDVLRTALARVESPETGPLPTAVQCARLRRVVGQLEEMHAELKNNVPPEFIAEKNRAVLGHLTSVIGEVGTEDILDRVFNDFCIGK